MGDMEYYWSAKITVPILSASETQILQSMYFFDHFAQIPNIIHAE